MEAAESPCALNGRCPSPFSGLIWNRPGSEAYGSNAGITTGRITRSIADGRHNTTRSTIAGRTATASTPSPQKSRFRQPNVERVRPAKAR